MSEAPKLLELIHYNDSVGTDAKEVWEVDPQFVWMLIHNTHALNTFYISFDLGSNWKTIPAGLAPVEVKCPDSKTRIHVKKRIKVKASAPNTTFELLILRDQM